MAKDKQQKKKERERRVAQKKLAAAAARRANEKTSKEQQKSVPERTKAKSGTTPKPTHMPANNKRLFTQRRSGG
jgi:hypothetical protein